jgi:transcriptional regulator with XRE-family HTH domain
METRRALAALMAKRMLELDLRPVDVAERADLSKSYVSALLKGKVALPGAGKRRDLAAVLGVRHVDLLVAAGELAPEEVDAAAPPVASDFRLRLMTEVWPRVRPDVRAAVYELFRQLIAVPGMIDEAEQPPVVAVSR